MGFKVGFHGFLCVLWVLCIKTVDEVNTWTDCHHPTSKSMSMGPKFGFGDLKLQ